MSELTKALPESRAGRVKIVESLRSLERGARKRGMTTYFVQMVGKPHQIITFNGWHPFLIFLPVQYVADSIVKLGRRLVEVTEPFQWASGGHREYPSLGRPLGAD